MSTRALSARIGRLGRWLADVYALDLSIDAGRFLVAPERARELLPAESPRSGVLALEEEEALHLGIYLDPLDSGRLEILLEETSHLVCLVWHASRDLQISPLVLEIQGEIDRYVYDRLAGRHPLGHFERFQWAGWLDGSSESGRYEHAHRVARRYCQRLQHRYPHRADTPGLLRELRHFYRASPSIKLCH